MTTWADFEEAEPALAERARRLLVGDRPAVIATLRNDGSPRVSGIDLAVVAGELWFASALGTRLCGDLERDPRFALHGPPSARAEWAGDAKLNGRAVREERPERLEAAAAALGVPDRARYAIFRVDVDQVIVTTDADAPDRLAIALWRPTLPLSRMTRQI
jgi:hypothetical protein